MKRGDDQNGVKNAINNLCIVCHKNSNGNFSETSFPINNLVSSLCCNHTSSHLGEKIIMTIDNPIWEVNNCTHCTCPIWLLSMWMTQSSPFLVLAGRKWLAWLSNRPSL